MNHKTVAVVNVIQLLNINPIPRELHHEVPFSSFFFYEVSTSTLILLYINNGSKTLNQ